MTNTPKALAQQRARYRANNAAGLTVYGTVRKNYQWPELDGLPPKERMNERIRICTVRARRAKKNSGIAFILEKKPANNATWKEETKIFRSQIDSLAESLHEIYEELPPKAKSKCLILSQTLSKIRNGLKFIR